MSIAQQNDTNTATGEATFPRLGAIRLTWQRAALFSILVLSAVLNFYRLGQNGYTNEFYAAAVRSMLTSWHNFFYNAYDPGGFITIDKPPVAFWFQTISAWIFGFSGLSILIPSAVAGVISVVLVYDMVRRAFGTIAGLLAALALAVTPISVVMNRHNNPESLLVLSLVAAAWAMSRATAKGRLGWLLLAVAFVGIGFNIKMLEAFVVLPAFYLLYFLLAPLGWWKRIAHLALATIVCAAVSLSWAVAVDLTPANMRPYIGGSGNNSVMSLIINYNGLGRIDGSEFGGGSRGGFNGQPPSGFPGRAGNGGQTRPGSQSPGGKSNSNGQTQPGFQFPFGGGNANGNRTFGNGGGRGGNPVIAGRPGLWRMFDQQLAGEAGWLLPLALLGLVIAGVQTWFRFSNGEQRALRQQSLLLWGGWLLTYMAVFSMAKGIFHSYYLVMLAPAIAALFGAGIEALWYAYRQGGWQRWLLPLALLVAAVFQVNLLSGYTDWNLILAWGVIVLELIAACALLVIPPLLQKAGDRWAIGIAAVAVLGLLVTPLSWAVHAITNPTYSNATLPTAVPAGRSGGIFGSFMRVSGNDLLTTLQTNWNMEMSGLAIAFVVLLCLTLAIHLFRMHMHGRRWIEQVMTVATAAVVLSLGLAMVTAVLPPVTSAASGINDNRPPSTGMIGNPAMGLGNYDKLIAFLEANRAGYTYLLATTSSQNASPIIIETGQPVMALGGFMGSDQVVTSQQLAQLVANKTIRYFLLDGMRMGFGGSQQPTGWVQQNCTVVDTQLWSGGTSTRNQGQLYDCAPQH